MRSYQKPSETVHLQVFLIAAVLAVPALVADSSDVALAFYLMTLSSC